MSKENAKKILSEKCGIRGISRQKTYFGIKMGKNVELCGEEQWTSCLSEETLSVNFSLMTLLNVVTSRAQGDDEVHF
jgi:hypothetical protein